MEHRCQHDHANNNGFLLGLLVGVLVTLLFVTRKGRKILRMLTDEGIEKIEDLEKILKEKMADMEEDEDDLMKGDDYSVSHSSITPSSVSPSAVAMATEQNHVQTTHVQESTQQSSQSHAVIHSVKPSPRRFFRGVPKR